MPVNHRILRLTRSQIEICAAIRKPAWLDAILAIAQREGELHVIHTCDWHALTRIHTTGLTKRTKRPCRPSLI